MHRAAHVLNNRHAEDAGVVRRRFDGLVAAIHRRRDKAGGLAAIGHFREIFCGYRPGLFHAYDVPGLRRTNNVIEQPFGSRRYHERRANGHKTASPVAVLRGEVRL